MAAKKVTVTYQDGREEVVKVLPRAIVMAEQHFSGYKTENANQTGFYLAWASLIVEKKESVDYENWLDRVEDVEDYEDPEKPEEPIEEIPPTQSATSGDVSSE
jgi:hypothetical protein